MLSSSDRDRYAMLDGIDNKAGVIAQISAVLLVLLFLPAIRSQENGDRLLDLAALLLALGILLLMMVLLFNPKPSPVLVNARTYVFNVAWVCVFAAMGMTLWRLFQAYAFAGA